MSNPSFKIITNTLIGTSRHIIAETSHEVCSSHIEIWLSNDTITSVKFVRGCSGNTQCIAALIEGMNVNDVINKISNIKCQGRTTSCPDQLAQILISAISKSNIEAIVAYGIPDAMGAGWEKLGEFRIELSKIDIEILEYNISWKENKILNAWELAETHSELYDIIDNKIKTYITGSYPIDFSIRIES